ncbi:MAG: hypothetical protein MPJ24_11930, partial [Pirellulaceae bacterium]|nr:hypothetical protein [Pirellulaceae bacterium]
EVVNLFYTARVVDTGRTDWRYDPYNPDSDIWQEPTNLQESLQDFMGYNYHPNAVYEIRTLDKYNGSGQQCTYDKKGKLITHGFDVGTEDKAWPSGLPYSDHSYQDVQPYDWAMELDGYPTEPKKYLKMYLEVRRQNNGNNCPKNP